MTPNLVYDNYLRPMEADVKQKYFRHARFKGGTTVNNTSTYTPTEYELQLQKAQADYANAVSPNALWLNDTARKLLENSLGAVQVDYNKLNNQAQQLIAQNQRNMAALAPSNTAAANAANNVLGRLSPQYMTSANKANGTLGTLAPQYMTGANKANTTLSSLQNGVLPSAWQTNMQNAIRSSLQNTMGMQLNSLANRGVLNSSVTTSAMNDISKNAADTVAQQYQNNINTVAGLANQQNQNTANALDRQASLANQQNQNTANALDRQASLANRQFSNTLGANSANAGIYGNLINSATQPITTAASAQEAAQKPALNLWNASLGLNGSTTSALAAAAGKGTTTSTSHTSGGGGLLSGLMGGLL